MVSISIGNQAASAQPTLLIVDDQQFFVDMHVNLLRPRGYTVTGAGSAAAGFDESKRLQPDLILLDVEMPSEDGFSLCRRLKAEPATSQIPIIMLTATLNPKLTELAFKAGAEATVLKSMNVEKLLNIIKVVLQTEKAQ